MKDLLFASMHDVCIGENNIEIDRCNTTSAAFQTQSAAMPAHLPRGGTMASLDAAGPGVRLGCAAAGAIAPHHELADTMRACVVFMQLRLD